MYAHRLVIQGGAGGTCVVRQVRDAGLVTGAPPAIGFGRA